MTAPKLNISTDEAITQIEHLTAQGHIAPAIGETMKLIVTAYRQQVERGDGLAADLGHAVQRATELDRRLDRINAEAHRWLASPEGAADYDDPADVFRDCAVIALHLACGRTFPDAENPTPLAATSTEEIQP